jgi:hypothetical protein
MFACLDTAAKYSSRFVPVMEVAFLRYAGAMIVAVFALRPWRELSLYAFSQTALRKSGPFGAV